MGRQRHSIEQIIVKLREAEVELGRGKTVPEACRKIGVTEQTYHRWRRRLSARMIDRAFDGV